MHSFVGVRERFSLAGRIEYLKDQEVGSRWHARLAQHWGGPI